MTVTVAWYQRHVTTPRRGDRVVGADGARSHRGRDPLGGALLDVADREHARACSALIVSTSRLEGRAVERLDPAAPVGADDLRVEAHRDLGLSAISSARGPSGLRLLL
jgi:hypothetical protein